MKNQKKHRSSSGDGHRRWCECGVSEVIGVVLILALVVVGGTVVGTQLLSQPAPKSIPSVNFLANYDQGQNFTTLYHTGGDTLKAGEYHFVVQYSGSSRPVTVDGTSDWQSGQRLPLPNAPGEPEKVTLVYTGNGVGETALRSVVMGDIGSGLGAAAQNGNAGTGDNPGGSTGTSFTITPVFDSLKGGITCNGTPLVNNAPFIVDAGDMPTLTFTGTTGFGFNRAIILGDGDSASTLVTSSPYLFTTGIDRNYTVTATFNAADPALTHYTITPIFDYLTGNITCNGTQLVSNIPSSINAGDTPTLTFPGSNGFKFSNAVFSGDKGASITVTTDPYIFTTGIDQNYTVTATFSEIVPALAHYTITPIFDNLKGNITCNGTPLVNNIPFEVNAGDIPTLTFPSSVGFMFDTALISGDKGASATVTGSPYTFTTGVNQNYTITATFSEIVPARYTITPIFDSLKGKVSCNGTQLVNNTPFEVDAGDMPAFTFLPSTGFMFNTALISGDKGISATATGSPYTFDRGVDQNYTVDVNFTVAMFTITANTGPLGTINQSGSRSFPYHSTPSFGVEAISGYHIVNIIVDGKEQGPAPNYTFSPLEADHTITADFAKDVYTIMASAGSGGSITPTGSVPVNFGDNQTFTITPGSGNTIDDVVVDGISMGQVSSFTFNQVKANHTIQAFFDINGVGPYSIEGDIWNDLNENGIWDSGEPPLAGWTVQALGKGQAQDWYVVKSVVSDSTGHYKFDKLPKDHYHVVQVQHPGWDQTWPTKHEGYYVENLNQGRDDKHQHVTGDNFGNHMTTTSGNSILLNNPMNIGALKDGTYIQFTNLGQGDWIDMASGRINIPQNSDVKIAMNGDQTTGKIYMIDGALSTYQFANVKVYLNGQQVATGQITGIWMAGTTNWQSTLTYVMSSYNSGAQFVVDGTNIINPPWWPYQNWGINVYGISPQNAPYSKVLNFDYKSGDTYLVCSGSYDLFTA